MRKKETQTEGRKNIYEKNERKKQINKIQKLQSEEIDGI